MGGNDALVCSGIVNWSMSWWAVIKVAMVNDEHKGFSMWGCVPVHWIVHSSGILGLLVWKLCNPWFWCVTVDVYSGIVGCGGQRGAPASSKATIVNSEIWRGHSYIGICDKMFQSVVSVQASLSNKLSSLPWCLDRLGENVTLETVGASMNFKDIVRTDDDSDCYFSCSKYFESWYKSDCYFNHSNHFKSYIS